MQKRKFEIHRVLSYMMVLSLVIMSMPGMEVIAANKDYSNYESIEKANSGDIITLKQDVTVTRLSGNTRIFVKNGCTLNGNGHLFTGSPSDNTNLLYSSDTDTYSGSTFNLTHITLKSNKCRILNPRNNMVFNADSTVTFSQDSNIVEWEGALAQIEYGATLNLNGSTVNGLKNSGGKVGGAFYIKNTGTVNLDYSTTSNQITNCEASGQGGVAYVENGGRLTITDATIRNNSAVSNGGAIYLAQNGSLTLKGNTNITDNTVSGSANNIYLAANAVITLDGFTGSAGVTTESVPTTTSEIKIATGATVADATRITSDNTSYFVRYKSADRCLYLTSVDPASSVTDMINSLPSEQDITLGDEDAIVAARTAYNDLTDVQKARVSSATLTKLINAENRLASLKAPSGTSSSSGSSTAYAESPAVSTRETASGETKVTDAKGEAISNSLVTVKITDASGNTVSKQVLTDENGNIAKKEVVNVSNAVSASGKTTEVEKSYLAASDGTIYDTPGFTDVSDVMGLDRSDLSEADKVVYIKEDGSLMQAEKFTVTTKTGKKVMYAADENCNIIRNGFFNAKKTGVTGKAAKSGASYFAKGNGQIITNALFTVKPTKTGKVKVKINKKGSGPEETVIIDDMELYSFLKGAKASIKQAQYYATKSGKIAKNKWVNVGAKDYYCGSSGKITKTKKHIINNT